MLYYFSALFYLAEKRLNGGQVVTEGSAILGFILILKTSEVKGYAV